MRRVEQMAEEFGQYNFNFIHYVIQKAENSFIILINRNFVMKRKPSKK